VALNLALIGAGRIGAVHAANIRANPATRLAWVADPRLEAVQPARRASLTGTADRAEPSRDKLPHRARVLNQLENGSEARWRS
jgi:myo-inositol 2-dehydrogenase/D-chiro-inositol 1-dehydrogenase